LAGRAQANMKVARPRPYVRAAIIKPESGCDERRYFNLGIGLVGLIAVACGLFAARSLLTATAVPAAPQPVPVTAAEVAHQDVPIVLEGLGTVQARGANFAHKRVDLKIILG
jgi:ethanolamine transporter EutH